MGKIRIYLSSVMASDVSTEPVMSSDECPGTPNKKQRINLDIVSDQSTPEAKLDGETILPDMNRISRKNFLSYI